MSLVVTWLCSVALLVSTTAHAAVEIRAGNTGDCPAGAAVASRLAELAPERRDPPGGTLYATLFIDDGGALTVSLVRASGTIVGIKTLPALPGCQDRAEATAALIAVWLGEQQTAAAVSYPHAVPRPAPPPPPPPAAVDVSRRWAPQVSAAGLWRAPVEGATGSTPGALAEVSLGRNGGSTRAVLMGWLVRERTLAFPPGTARLGEFGLCIGGSKVLWDSNNWRLRARAALGVSVVNAEGTDLPDPRHSSGIAPEVWGDLEVATPPLGGAARFFVAAGLTERLRNQTLISTSPASEQSLSRSSVHVALGVTVPLGVDD